MDRRVLVVLLVACCQVCVPVLGEECEDVAAVQGEVMACLQEVQTSVAQQMQNLQQQEQLAAFCANTVPALQHKVDTECTAPYAGCPEQIVSMMDASLQSVKQSLSAACSGNTSQSMDGDCTGKIMGCMANLMTKIQEEGMDPQAVLGGLGQGNSMNQEELCSVIGDIDFGEILSCILNAQAECSDEQPDMSAVQMQTAIQSMKYICTDECMNLETKMNETMQCLPTVMAPYMAGEIPEDKHEEACKNITTSLQQCMVKKSACCKTVLITSKMALEAAFSQGPVGQLTNACPKLLDSFDSLDDFEAPCAAGASQEGDNGSDDTSAGITVLPVFGWLLLALFAQVF